MDESIVEKLIKNDIETYIGVMVLRQSEEISELGYRNWLLTTDKMAWEIRDKLRDEFNDYTLASPLMSFAYLLNSMIFGPERNRVGKVAEQSLPLFLDDELTESTPVEFLKMVNQIRQDNEGLPERVIRRKVRDYIDQERRKTRCQVSEDDNTFAGDMDIEL